MRIRWLAVLPLCVFAACVDTLPTTVQTNEQQPEYGILGSHSKYKCQPLPAGAAEPDFAPCDVVSLTRLSAEAPAGAPKVAIVLVHGWSKDIGEWTDYYEKQGILCEERQYKSREKKLDCVIKPEMEKTLPAKYAWPAFIDALSQDFPALEIWGASYESWRGIEDNGRMLADRILQKLRGYAGIILVGHSMGGLVSRYAYYGLTADPPSGYWA